MSDVINKAWRDFARTKDGPMLAATLTMEAESLDKQLAAATKERDELLSKLEDAKYQLDCIDDIVSDFKTDIESNFKDTVENRVKCCFDLYIQSKQERDETREALREIVYQIAHIGGQYYQLASIDKDEVECWRKAAGLDV